MPVGRISPFVLFWTLIAIGPSQAIGQAITAADATRIHDLSEKRTELSLSLWSYEVEVSTANTKTEIGGNKPDDKSETCLNKLSDLAQVLNLSNVDALIEIDASMIDHRDEIITLSATSKAIGTYLDILKYQRDSLKTNSGYDGCDQNAAYIAKQQAVFALADDIETALKALIPPIIAGVLLGNAEFEKLLAK